MNDELRNEVLRRWHGGQSGRDIARDLHLSRKTVAKVLAEHRQQRANGTSRRCPSRARAAAAWSMPTRPRCGITLARYPDMSVVRLLEELRSRGYKGGYTVLRQRVKQLRKQCHRPPVERFETGPGVQAQMDWAMYTHRLHSGRPPQGATFQLRAGLFPPAVYPLHRFPGHGDDAPRARAGLRAPAGAAATCLYDNMKVVVARYEDGEPIYNTRFLAFATHYGFRPVACRPRRPQTKGKVERPFSFIEKNLLSGREFRSLDHLNEVAAWWLAEVADVRIHRQTQRRPLDMHAEELPAPDPLARAALRGGGDRLSHRGRRGVHLLRE